MYSRQHRDLPFVKIARNQYEMLGDEGVETADTLSSSTNSSNFSGSSTCVSDTNKSKSTSKSKKKKKMKKKPTTVTTQEEEQDKTQNEDKDKESKQPIEDDPSQWPLERRLEMAAAIPDTHSALLGLLGWSRLYVHTETVLCFFQSNAFSLLISNVLRSQPTAAILENLEALLVNCLSVENSSKTAPHRHMAGEVVAAVKAIAEQMKDSADDEANDIQAEAERAVQALSHTVCAYALSLHGVDLNSPLTKDIQDLEAKIGQLAKEDDAVRGQTIQESFQRRDLRSDALTLHEMRLKKLTELVEERVHEQEPVDDKVDGKEDHVLEENALSIQDETKMHELTKALQDMQDRKDAELAPLRKKKAEASMKAQSLRQKQEELEAQLRAVESELQRVVKEEQQADKGMRVVEERFIADTTQFHTEHHQVMRRFSQAQRHRVIATEVKRVRNEVRQVQLAHSQVHTLRAKRTACSLQELEASLNYFESELPCVKMMMSRVEENATKLATARSEALSYRTLGVASVADELETKATKLETYLEEDRMCLLALRKRDEELLGIMHRILTDPSLRDAIADVNEKVHRESHRMIDYVSKLYDERDKLLTGETSAAINKKT